MLNEYETQSELNPKLWDGDELHPKVRTAFLKIAKAFYDFLDVSEFAQVEDVILIGSNANYNWTEHSDIDLHVLINYLKVDSNYHIVNNYFHAKKSVWNEHYPLTYKGMNIELYAQDSQQKLHATVGIYSVMKGKWLKKPDSTIISVDDQAIALKADPYEYEIDSLKSSDPHVEKKILSIKKRLKHLRQTGLEAEGEYSVENMAYKHLRNKGYLERLKQLEKTVKMDSLKVEHSVNELENPFSKEKMSGLVDKTKQQVKQFISATKNESEETKMALAMILQYINGQQLTQEEWKWIRNQMVDVVKMLGLTTMAIAPGGSLVAILAKTLKADKYLLPSSFKKTDQEKEVTESLVMHVTGEKSLDADGWKQIINKTAGVVDSNGQWSHPGKCTMIPTQDGGITMKNVPHAVLGIDNTGHMQMMQPEQQYQFPGRLVFEIPHTAQWQTMIMQIQNAVRNGSKYK